jgi:hypothetical protein
MIFLWFRFGLGFGAKVGYAGQFVQAVFHADPGDVTEKKLCQECATLRICRADGSHRFTQTNTDFSENTASAAIFFDLCRSVFICGCNIFSAFFFCSCHRFGEDLGSAKMLVALLASRVASRDFQHD